MEGACYQKELNILLGDEFCMLKRLLLNLEPPFGNPGYAPEKASNHLYSSPSHAELLLYPGLFY